MLPLSLIAAVGDNNVIGVRNQLPWHLPADLKYFKLMTMGKPIIMGRNTWESIGRPLPNRLNIVVSRLDHYQAEGAYVCDSFGEAMDYGTQWAKEQRVGELMLIGGAKLYALALEANLVSKMYLTRVHLSPEGDAYFPSFDQNAWQKIEESSYSAVDDQPAYTFETWARN